MMYPLTQIYDVAFVDLDGVVYAGARAIEFAPQALAAARTAGMRLAFVTNNASRTVETIATHLTTIGVAASPTEIVSSAQAAARLLGERLPPGSKVLLIGGEGLEVALRENHLSPVATLDAQPAAVVQGFAPQVGWQLLAEGAYAVAAGLPWVATNVDPTLPTERGWAPGNGTLVDAIRTTTGCDPEIVGKPQPPMHREAILRTGARRPLVVGDRLDTDIEGANISGTDSLAVLTGVTDPVELILAPPPLRPTYIGRDLRALHATPADLSVGAGQNSYGRWTAVVDGNSLQVIAQGSDQQNQSQPAHSEYDADQALRAACGAAWAADTPVDPASVRAALHRIGLLAQ
jgi:HAD superfamily hydrolase (TIGR01450 family)